MEPGYSNMTLIQLLILFVHFYAATREPLTYWLGVCGTCWHVVHVCAMVLHGGHTIGGAWQVTMM